MHITLHLWDATTMSRYTLYSVAYFRFCG